MNITPANGAPDESTPVEILGSQFFVGAGQVIISSFFFKKKYICIYI